MGDLGTAERIEKRIDQHKREHPWTRKEQIACLITRNHEFYWAYEPDAHESEGWELTKTFAVCPAACRVG